MKKVQEKKKQARAIQDANRAKLIAEGLLNDQEDEPRDILNEKREEDVLF